MRGETAIMPTFDDAFDGVRAALTRQFGSAPREFEDLAAFDAMVAVLLDRSLGAGRWRLALDGLSDEGLLDPERLADAEILEIADAVPDKRSVANPRTIAPLKRLSRWVIDQGRAGNFPLDDDDTGSRTMSVDSLREGLSAIKGIGPAAADAMILFALKRPSYPVDRATFRVLVRHGWLDSTSSYDEARELLVDRAESALHEDERPVVTALMDLSHGMERLGRQFCRATAAHCSGCPLEHLLPEGGPREVDA
jgi:endonuclease III related protein